MHNNQFTSLVAAQPSFLTAYIGSIMVVRRSPKPLVEVRVLADVPTKKQQENMLNESRIF